MLEDYNKIMDKLVVSSKLENNTIEKLRDRSNQNSNKLLKTDGISLRNLRAVAACTVILILGTIAIGKVHTLIKSVHSNNTKIIVQNPIGDSKTSTEEKETFKYNPNTVQYRLQTENPINISNSAELSVKSPTNRDIKSLYGSSKDVVKGYVYSTEYFWSNSNSLKTLYTKSVIAVEKSYKLGIKQGDKISVFESGGVTTLKDYIEKTSVKEKKDFETKGENFDPYFGKSPDMLVDYKSFLGISAMRPGQEVVLFLSQQDSKDLGEYSGLGYWVNSAEGGKMILDKGTYRQIIPEVFNTLIESNSVGENNLDKLISYASGEGERP